MDSEFVPNTDEEESMARDRAGELDESDSDEESRSDEQIGDTTEHFSEEEEILPVEMAHRNAPREKRPINRLGDHMGNPDSGTSYDDTQFLQQGATPLEQLPAPEPKRKPDRQRSVNDDHE